MSALTVQRKSLLRALWISTLTLAALSALAFWPAKRWAPPARPGLERPIVLDAVVQHTSQAESGAAP